MKKKTPVSKKTGVFIHPLAVVEPSEIGAGTRIWAFAHVLKGARIGADCNICDQVFVEGEAVLGDRVTVKNGVSLWNGVVIEDDVFIGPAAVFTNDLWPRSRGHRWPVVGTVVRKGATIGANATIRCGIEIGSWATVGAGAVVTKDVPDHALVVGVPAKRVGTVCRCGHPFPGRASRGALVCRECGFRIELPRASRGSKTAAARSASRKRKPAVARKAAPRNQR